MRGDAAEKLLDSSVEPCCAGVHQPDVQAVELARQGGTNLLEALSVLRRKPDVCRQPVRSGEPASVVILLRIDGLVVVACQDLVGRREREVEGVAEGSVDVKDNGLLPSRYRTLVRHRNFLREKIIQEALMQEQENVMGQRLEQEKADLVHIQALHSGSTHTCLSSG
eukprot:752569-Hanusia_phi.AAC.1